MFATEQGQLGVEHWLAAATSYPQNALLQRTAASGAIAVITLKAMGCQNPPTSDLDREYRHPPESRLGVRETRAEPTGALSPQQRPRGSDKPRLAWRRPHTHRPAGRDAARKPFPSANNASR